MDTFPVNLICFVCLCLIGLADSEQNLMLMSEPDRWFEVGTDASVICRWEHTQPEASQQVITWKAESTGIRKNTRNSTDKTYVFDDPPIDAERQSEETDWIGTESEGFVTQSSRLTIYNIQVTDPKDYTCEVEIAKSEKSRIFRILPYQTPTIAMFDINVEVDIREPLQQEIPTAAVLSANETFGNNSSTEGGETLPDENDSYNGYANSNAADPDYDAVGDDPDYDAVGDAPNSRRRRADEEDWEGAAEADGSEKIEVQCLIEDSYPKAFKIEFLVGESYRFDPTTVKWTQDVETKLYTGVATLELEAKAEYDSKAVTCSAWLDVGTDELETQSHNTSSTIKISHDITFVRTILNPPIAHVGESVQIECQSDGNPRPIFQLNGNAGTDDFVQSDDGRKFTIQSVTKMDEGTYTCEASLKDDRVDPPEVRFYESENRPLLRVLYIEGPTLNEPDEIVILKGDSKEVICTAEANPIVDVEWKKNGLQFSHQRTLQIDDAKYDDEGEYTCVVSNVVGSRSKSFNLKVEGKCEADFKKPLVKSAQAEGGNYYAKLECVVTGRPKCIVDITSESNFKGKGEKTEDGHILVYNNFQRLASPATFFCTAYNSRTSPLVNVSRVIDSETSACCQEPQKAGLNTGAIIGIILLVLVIMVGIPVACYFVKKRNTQSKKNTPADAEAASPEKESLNKEASSEDSDTGSLPPPPADMDHDHRLNSAHEMTTFSTNQ